MTKICQSFTCKTTAKIKWHRCDTIITSVTATLRIIIEFMSRTPPMNNGYLEPVRQQATPIETSIANTNPAAALTASRRRHDFRFVISFFHLYLLAIGNEWLACWTHAQKGPVQIANCSHPLCLCPPSSKIDSSPLKGCGVTAGLAESNGSLPSGL